jgi:DNA repair protein SbcC/Rad50
MEKLRKLELNNFQAHENSTLEFCDGVNIIIGDTDSGKTSIFSALRKLMRDNPPGADFISTWGNKSSIRLTGDNGTVVERSITCKKDRKLDSHGYTIISPDGKSEDYTGFGRTIPDDVVRVLGMPEISVGSKSVDINLADQHDSYFLVKESDGLLRVQLFSKLSHADVFESVRTSVKTSERSLRSELKAKSADLAVVENSIAEFSKFKQAQPYLVQAKELLTEISDLTKVSKLYSKAVELDASIQNIDRTLGNLELLLTKFVDVVDELNTYSSSLQILYEYNKRLKQAQVVLDKIGDCNRLEELIAELDLVLPTLDENTIFLNNLCKKRDLLTVADFHLHNLPDINLVNTKIAFMDSVNEQLAQEKVLLSKLRKAQDNLLLVDTMLSETDVKLHSLTVKGVCPTCGMKIDLGSGE